MSKFVIAQPPQLTGDQKRDMAQVFSYLYRMNENLQIALSSLDAGNFTTDGLEEVRGGTAAQERQAAQAQEMGNLRSLIVKSASRVEAEMDALEETLKGEYLAISDFGTYRESITNEILATAEGVVQSYGYDAQIQALADAGASFHDYQTQTEQYIKTGLLYYDGSVPRIGVAVGENLTTVIVDGEEVLTRSDLCATFTSDRLSFWMGGVEVAYVSNSRLHIAAADVDQMDVGSWRISHTDGFTVEWVG